MLFFFFFFVGFVSPGTNTSSGREWLPDVNICKTHQERTLTLERV